MSLDKFEDYDIVHDDPYDSLDYRIIGIGIDGSQNSHHAVQWGIFNYCNFSIGEYNQSRN